MTYDSSLSQTQNSHSICHSHPITDSYSPWKIEVGVGERNLKAQALDPRTGGLM